MRLATSVERRRRIRRAVRHVEERLQAQPDARLLLTELADIACISLFHFIRLYHGAVGETPQVTLRRLRLETARQRLAANPALSVTEVAFESGYDSSQAFTRAYRRQFGTVPSAREAHIRREAAVSASIVELPALQMRAIDIEESWAGAWSTYDELIGHLDVADVPRRSQEMFGVISPDRDFDQACALENAAVNASSRLEGLQLDGGWHVCLTGQPASVWQRLSDDALLKQARSVDRPTLLRYLNDPAYRVDAEQRIKLYVPLRPGLGSGDVERLL